MPRRHLSYEPGNAGQPLVGLLGPAVERDLDRERPPLGEIVGDAFGVISVPLVKRVMRNPFFFA